MKFKYVTSNRGKFEEATRMLAPLQLEQVSLEIKEIQGSPEEILWEKIHQALKLVPPPFLIEDVCLFCPALGGLPGPYVKDFLSTLGPLGFAELLNKFEDRRAGILCTVGYVLSPGEVLFFKGEAHGTVIVPKRGDRELKWQDFMIPEGFKRTFGEMDEEEYDRCSARGKALATFKEHL